jgi:hypothetical protein
MHRARHRQRRRSRSDCPLNPNRVKEARARPVVLTLNNQATTSRNAKQLDRLTPLGLELTQRDCRKLLIESGQEPLEGGPLLV